MFEKIFSYSKDWLTTISKFGVNIATFSILNMVLKSYLRFLKKWQLYLPPFCLRPKAGLFHIYKGHNIFKQYLENFANQLSSGRRSKLKTFFIDRIQDFGIQEIFGVTRRNKNIFFIKKFYIFFNIGF